MKRIFFFALASLALASCSQDEEFVAEKGSKSNADNGALSFSTYTAGATRAATVDAAAVKESGFQIAAVYDNALYFVAGETAKVTTSKDDNNDEIFETVSDTYYWPSFSAGNMGFRGFNLGVGAEWNKEYQSINFDLKDNAADQKDLVIAYDSVSAKPTAHGDGIQPLNFTHALSKVNFTFKGATADKYTINKVEVIAAGKKGDASPIASFVKEKVTKVSADLKQSDCVSWDFTAITADALVKKNDGAKAAQGVLYTYYDNTTGVAAASLEKQNLMLLPQTGRIAVRVYYKVEDANGKLIGNCGYSKTDAQGRHNATTGIYGCKTVVINLGTDNDNSETPALIPAWEAGKAYNFTMTLPKDNFIGDISGDGVADGSDTGMTEDYDGDGDKDKSEFDVLTPIKFCVTVSAWENADPANSNITIK